jgi:glycosyltransferase involved in cell wall biosynthesis
MFFLLGVATAIQFWYLAFLHAGFRKLIETNRYRLTQACEGKYPVSVIVAARDEESHIAGFLDALQAQNYHDFEVILVDDGSADRTARIIAEHSISAPGQRFHLIRLETPHGKRRAIEAGIAEAAHDLVVLTDADCTPAPDWLDGIGRAHASGSEPVVVVGYAPNPSDGTLLAGAVSYETFITGVMTAATVGAARPFHAVGRNLSYSRTMFRRVGGFGETPLSMSGDDDLLLQRMVRLSGAKVVHPLEESTFVPSPPPGSWRAWVHQKRRHASAGKHYPLKAQVHLALFQGSGILLWAAPFLLGAPGAGLLAIRLAVQYLALRRPAGILNERSTLRGMILWDLIYTAIQAFIMPLGLLRPPRQWRAAASHDRAVAGT